MREGSGVRARRAAGRRSGSGDAVQELRQRTMAWAVRLRVNPRTVRVQDMHRKWGSCTSSGTVTLAYDLVHRTGDFQDYVIVHELLHLRLPNHGRLFKALLTAHVPGWRELEATAASGPAARWPR